MERFVFFNTDNASVLHYADFLRNFDAVQNLALNSYTFLQTSNFSIRSIYWKSRLICFAKEPNYSLALTIEFAEDSTTEEDGYQFAVHMLQLFMQQFGHILNGKLSRKSFKSYNKSLKLIIDQVLEPIMEKIADSSQAEFLYVSFLKSVNAPESLAVNTKGSFMSPSSSVNTDILAMPKSSNVEIKKKYPFILEREAVNNSPQQLFYRLYSKEKSISSQVVAVINSAAVLAHELMEMEKDELQIMELCLSSKVIKAIKYHEMLLVISVVDRTPEVKQVRQLYNWAKFLIA